MNKVNYVSILTDAQITGIFFGLQKKIKSFSSLREGWNGYGALPVPGSVIKSAIRFLKNLRATGIDLLYWEVFPTGRASVQFEKSVAGKYMEIEVYEERMSFYGVGSSGEAIENPDMNFEGIVWEIKSFF